MLHSICNMHALPLFPHMPAAYACCAFFIAPCLLLLLLFQVREKVPQMCFIEVRIYKTFRSDEKTNLILQVSRPLRKEKESFPHKKADESPSLDNRTLEEGEYPASIDQVGLEAFSVLDPYSGIHMRR